MTTKIETAASNWLFAEPVEYFTTGATIVVAVLVRESGETVLIDRSNKAKRMPSGKNPMFNVNATFPL